ncbi:MAG: ATP-binding protein [bacterium]|nr:ATP-binding protein [bacterium]
MSDLEQLERQLLTSPFDAELRSRYAQSLFDTGQYEDSLGQWILLAGQHDTVAEYHARAALCCHRLGRANDTDEHLDRARSCSGFAALAALVGEIEQSDAEVVEENAPAPVGLRAVAGGRVGLDEAADVVLIGATDKIRFSDVVGMQDLKKILKLKIVEPFVNPGLFQRFKKRSGGGVLLYGPPGCGKTMMARAIATECKANFNAVGISDVLSMWMGQSEQNLAGVFEKAREEVPSVLFFDELDALAFSRSKAASDHTRTTVNEFLNQLDGMVGNNEKLLVLAATNMPWDVDDAMQRPGRFDRRIFVPPPDAEARREMFEAKLRDVPTDRFDADALATRCEGFSGADIDAVIEYAKEEVLTEILDSGTERCIRQEDLAQAAEQVTPSTLEWLKTARNLVKFGGGSGAYKEVEKYLRQRRLM